MEGKGIQKRHESWEGDGMWGKGKVLEYQESGGRYKGGEGAIEGRKRLWVKGEVL